MSEIYDFVVIGAGISACTFSVFLNKRFPDASILIVEQGRRIGGRATSRKSRRNNILEFDHGLPSISFSKHISKDIQTLISPLIDSRKLVNISKDILIINELGQINNFYTNKNIYRSMPFMMNFSHEIINQSVNPKKIEFLFQTLIKSIKRINYEWELKVDTKRFIKSKNIILSSSLIAHPRCLEVLKINSLPLRDAFISGEDEVVESLLKEIRYQKYLKRKIYILYIPNIKVVKNFNYRYLQIYFSTFIRKDLNFERIIFQRQSDESMIIVLHCCFTNKIIEINRETIIKYLLLIFVKHKIFLDLFLQASIIDTMNWRSSQPLNHFLPKELQWSSLSNIGFCGDWFYSSSCSGVESAMQSSIRLANIVSW